MSRAGAPPQRLRRQLLGAGAALATAWTCGSWRRVLAAENPSQALIRHRIPRSGEQLPGVGLGTSFFGTLDYPQARALIRRLHELGGRVIDTAAFYGPSEEYIGRALRELGLRGQMFLSTKFNARGHGFGPDDWIFGAQSFERSLRSLGAAHIDLLEVHKPTGTALLMPLMQQYRRAGRIRYLGVTTWVREEHELLVELMQRHELDFIQVDYSLGNRHAAERVLPTAQARNVAVMVNVPLGGQGASLLAQVRERPLPAWAAEFGAGSWTQFFLKYALSHPAVTCVIPGSTRLEHLDDNQSAGRGSLPDAGQRARMEAFWDTLDPPTAT